MKVYLGFDDTDTHDSLYGTGKLVRWFQSAMPDRCECIGVVRQQLFVCDEIPYTSHNSAACLIAEMPEPALLNEAIDRAANHLKHSQSSLYDQHFQCLPMIGRHRHPNHNLHLKFRIIFILTNIWIKTKSELSLNILLIII